MQRLVYTPRAYAFIKDQDGKIRDVSRYITAGSVTRRTDAVSSAEITLRNPKMIFTATAGHKAVFHPMDPITIYLKRVRNRPVRVFTGFLDKTPYLQLYPGTISLRASCTLKRLLYTYFDPALPYTQSFLTSYGWIPRGDGSWFSTQGLNDFRKENEQGVDDGSLGQLLHATLEHIGHWNDNQIYIEPLPSDLFTRLTKLAQEFEDDNDEAKREFEDLMKRILGVGAYGAGSSDVDVSGVDGDVAEIIYKVGRAMGVPYKHMLAAFMTGLVESNMRNLEGGDADSEGWRQERASLYKNPRNVPESAKRFFNECKQLDHGQTAGELAADVQRPAAQYRGRYADRYDDAVGLIRTTKKKVEVDDVKSGTQSHNHFDKLTRAMDQSGTGKTTGSDSSKLYSAIKGLSPTAGIGGGGRAYGASRAYGSHAGVDASAPMGTSLYAISEGVVTYSGSWGGEGNLVVIKATQSINGYPKNIRMGFGHMSTLAVKKGDSVSGGDYIGKSGAGSNGQPHLHFFVRTDDQPANGTMDPTPLLKAAARGEQPTGGPGGGNEDSSTGGSDDSLQNANAAAFFAELNLPSLLETTEALALKGERSLMNDKPLFPFIQQLCQSSLRSFQSLPDGKFFAFYPDYFGEMYHHPPYWLIDDIEVLDGNIDLADDGVVTHQYVVGDTSFSGNTTFNKQFSSGVVTIFNAFMASSVLERGDKQGSKKSKGPAPVTENSKRGMDTILDRDEAVAFLQRYGARPSLEDAPMIKSSYFEMFLAYQKFMLAWSRQFLTPFTFTFMPELYPGGKVGFPDHGLQMYIDEVTHSWDYQSGFMTQANLSAPSAYGAAKSNLPPNMVRAIVEPVEK